MKILVTGAGGASGICTILALKKSTDHIIIGCDCSEYSSGFYLAHEKFIIPSAEDDERGFLKEIINKVKKHKIDIIFPNVDEELLVFAKNKSNIPCNIVISPFSTVDVCNDKSKLISRLKNIVPLPVVRNISPSFLVKPKIGRGSRNIYKVESQEELEALFKYLSFRGMTRNDFIIQEFLPGKEYTVDALFDSRGDLVVAVPRQRIKTSGGVSIIGKTEKNNQIINFVKKISKKLKFLGPVNLQFKENKEGIPKLIEINPRCSGGMAITCESGVNIPKLTLDILNKKRPSKENLRWEEKIVFRYSTEV